MLEYYVVLRAVLKSKPHLRSCRARCAHCRILFLSDPRNRGRRDLHCPFGCREARRRRRSTERSTAYNRSPAGKLKKKIQNGKRSRERHPDPAPAQPRQEEIARKEPERGKFAAGVLEYLQVAVSLIEGRRVSREELVQMLPRAMRQRSFARERRIDYVVRALKEKPP